MTGSLRLSALLLLLLSRWASADLEKGEDEFVRSWVIIEEQLVPPSRDEPLQAAGGGGVATGGASAGRRITPKSVFVAPSFNKCSDNYRPDSMGRCVKVVKLNQAAQWDFLLKQLNSMYGPGGGGGGGGGFPMQPVSAPMYRPPVLPAMITTTAEPPSQKTDSPGPFQLNIPFAGHADSSYKLSVSAEPSSDERQTATASTTTATSTTVTGTVVTDDATVTVNTAAATTIDPAGASAVAGIAIDPEAQDDADTVTAEGAETTTAVNKLRPYRDRYQTTTQRAEDDTEEANTVTITPYDSPTTAPTDVKSKYVDSGSTTTVVPSKTVKPADVHALLPSSSASPPTVAVTTIATDDTETEEPATGAPTAATVTTEAADEEDVVTVLAVAAAPVDGVRPGSSTRAPPYADADNKKPRPNAAPDVVSPEYYDDQPEEPTMVPEPDCSIPNASRYYPACADFQQQQQQLQKIQQIQQQQQLLLQQHQQQQQFYQQQQQQQFYQHQQQQQLLLQQQHLPQQPQHNNHVPIASVKRPAAGASAQVRFPGDGDPAPGSVPENASPVRFPGSVPYRTTNKMYESSRHPMWWPTGWPEHQQQQLQQQPQQSQFQQQQPQSLLEPQSQSDEDTVYQQHRLQHHLPQQKQDVRLREFGSRLPKITSTTTVLPPSPPPPPTQWFHRFF